MIRVVRLILPAAVLAIGALWVACGDDEQTPTSAPTSIPTTAPTAAPTDSPTAVVSPTLPAVDGAIVMAGFAFTPAELTLPAGSTLNVTNADTAPHTMTADDGSFDTGILQPGSSGAVELAAAGTFTFKCTLHPSMTGTITVQ